MKISVSLVIDLKDTFDLEDTDEYNWFFNWVLGEESQLALISSEIGDEIGEIKKVAARLIPDSERIADYNIDFDSFCSVFQYAFGSCNDDFLKDQYNRYIETKKINPNSAEILDQSHQMYAEGSEDFKPSKRAITEYLTNRGFVASDEIDIVFDTLQKVWRWSCNVVKA